jgi:hypothetical protein
MPFGVGVLVVEHCALDQEFTHVSSVALHLLETLNWSSRGPRAEMEQVGELFLVESLHLRPEPLHDLVVGVELPLVVGVVPPVSDVNIGHSIQQHFHLIGFEHSDKVLGDDFVHAIPDRIKGPLNRLCTQVLHTSNTNKQVTMTQCRGSCWHRSPQCPSHFLSTLSTSLSPRFTCSL